MDINISISAPMTVPIGHLREVQSVLHKKYDVPNQRISYWDRAHAYDQLAFNRANAVIVINKDFSFKCVDLSPGVSKELTSAYKKGIPIYLAYKNANGQINFYDAILSHSNSTFIVTGLSGISGSSGKGGVFETRLDKYRTKTCIDAQAELEKMINQDELEKAAIRLMQNSTYGIRCVDPSYNSEQIKFPEVRRVYASLIDNPDYSDERLLLML